MAQARIRHIRLRHHRPSLAHRLEAMLETFPLTEILTIDLTPLLPGEW